MKNIVALSTPPLNGAIHIIRMTGPDVFEIINKISSQKIKKENYKIKMTNLVYKDQIIDQVLLMLYVNPKSYTGEDLIEINCHGNILIANEILEILINLGCRIAAQGEFTKTAFLNNKINLSQAMWINQISKTPSLIVKNIGMNSIAGKIKNVFKVWREEIFLIIGNLEVSIDYPEFDDVINITNNKILEVVSNISQKSKEIIDNYNKYKIIFNGIDVAIIGKPNVGKSTLLNKIIGDDRAIVSDIFGTTRDYIRESILFNGIKYNIIDTAGIRKTDDELENIGISKTKLLIEKSKIILYVIDGSKKITYEDKIIYDEIKQKNYIFIKTKKDINEYYKDHNGISIGKDDETNIIFLEIEKLLKITNFNFENIFISSQIELDYMLSIFGHCEDIIIMIEKEEPLDIIIEIVKILFQDIKLLLGETLNYEIFDEIFDNFCLGK